VTEGKMDTSCNCGSDTNLSIVDDSLGRAREKMAAILDPLSDSDRSKLITWAIDHCFPRIEGWTPGEISIERVNDAPVKE
jgi:hypothetical protein